MASESETVRKSGFEPDPRPKVCTDPNHGPPTMLVVPLGQRYRHVCQRCGATSYLYPTAAML